MLAIDLLINMDWIDTFYFSHFASPKMVDESPQSIFERMIIVDKNSDQDFTFSQHFQTVLIFLTTYKLNLYRKNKLLLSWLGLNCKYDSCLTCRFIPVIVKKLSNIVVSRRRKVYTIICNEYMLYTNNASNTAKIKRKNWDWYNMWIGQSEKFKVRSS